MKPRINMVTLGVDDLEAALRFYRDGLGFPTRGIVGREFAHGAVAFFQLQAGLQLAIWERRSLAHDTGLDPGIHGAASFALGHNVADAAQVDRIMARAAASGADIVKPAQKTFWGGYGGYFRDPDGHLWEIVFNPDLLPDG